MSDIYENLVEQLSLSEQESPETRDSGPSGNLRPTAERQHLAAEQHLTETAQPKGVHQVERRERNFQRDQVPLVES